MPITDSGNALVYDPNVALTYNTGPRLAIQDNTQLSLRAFYAVPQQNPATRYTSGNILDVDWSVTEQFGLFRAGVAGYYQTQITADHAPGGLMLADGNRFTDAGAGPVFEYIFPRAGVFVKAKYQYTFIHRNYVDEQELVLSTGFTF